MSSAAELFYNRRSRANRREERGLGHDRTTPDRDRHPHRRSSLRRRRSHFAGSEGMDLSRQPRALLRSEHEPPQSSDSSLVESGTSSGISNGSISSGRFIRPPSTSSGQLPSTVLQARARLMERLRGISAQQSRQEIGSSSTVILEELATIDAFVDRIRSQLANTSILGRSSGLGPEAINNLLHEVFKEAEHGGDAQSHCDCSVCLESFREGEVLLRLHCGHRFHCACLEPWLSTCADCPYCRAKVLA